MCPPPLELHQAAGARVTPEPNARVLTYGDVPGEYHAGLEGCLLLDATDRGRLFVGGSDAGDFLHRILAGQVKELEPGQGARNLLLSGKGKVLEDFDLWQLEQGFELNTAPDRAAGLLQQLDMYLFTDDVQLDDQSAECAPLELTGPQCEQLTSTVLGVELPAGERIRAELAWRGRSVIMERVPVAGSPGLRLDAGPKGAEELWQALIEAGATPGGLVAQDSLRVEAGCAMLGRDVDESVYPQEARLESGFSLDKGCYIGQEVVAKIDTYGGLNKCLFALRVDGDDPIAPGTRLFREEKGEWRDLGVVTSWAYSFALDAGVVLAYVKRRHQLLGARFRIGDGPQLAEIVELPLRAGAVAVTGPGAGDA